MALDEPTDKDEVQIETGFRVVVDKALLEQSSQIQVDFLNGPLRRGFQIKAAAQAAGCGPQASGCSSCG